MNASVTTELRERIRRQVSDPALFSRSFMRADLWEKQEVILRAIATHPRVAVKACHASGKTFLAALAVCWFLARYKEAVVVTTAPTWNQVEKMIWGEIHAAVRRSLYPFPKPLTTELKLADKRYAYGLSTNVTNQNEGVKFQGTHAENVLIVVDEAPGLARAIWDAIEGARAGGNVRILALGNPTVASGPFHAAFHEERATWKTFTISAFDTPNLAGLTLQSLIELPEDELDRNPRPYLTTRRWVKERLVSWGEKNPRFQARVFGNFPDQAEDALLSLTWLEKAKYSEAPASEPVRAGLDVAGPGEDETTLTVRKGPRIVLHESWPQEDPRGEVVAALEPFRAELEAVNVDSIGIGWGMYQHLKDLKFPAIAVNVGEAAHDGEKYANLKAELYWGLRMRFQAGDVSGLDDETAIGQLAGIRYKHNPRGQVIIESKDDARKRGVKSPDRAESVMLAYAEVNPLHGLLQYWSDRSKQKTDEKAVPPVPESAAELAKQPQSQKDEMFKRAATVKTLGKVVTAPQQTDCCPQCGNKFVSRYADGKWKCGGCGTSGQDKE